jgi:hypothetical protein
MPVPHRIDIHSHFFPPGYGEEWSAWAPKAGALKLFPRFAL